MDSYGVFQEKYLNSLQLGMIKRNSLKFKPHLVSTVAFSECLIPTF
jgi:hypothetical protein